MYLLYSATKFGDSHDKIPFLHLMNCEMHLKIPFCNGNCRGFFFNLAVVPNNRLLYLLNTYWSIRSTQEPHINQPPSCVNSRRTPEINIYTKCFHVSTVKLSYYQKKWWLSPAESVWKRLQKLLATLQLRRASAGKPGSSLIRCFILWNCLLWEK